MDVDYMIQAIKIVVSGQLKDNHDDTLIEKLITLIEKDVEDDVFTRSDEIKILTILADSLDMDQPDPTCFRLIAIILADLYISYGLNHEEDVLDSAFVAFIGASRMVSSSAELSMQSSFIRSYTYISEKNRNILDSNHIRSSDMNFLPEKITELIRNSSSYYVRSEAENLLIELIISNQGAIENDPRNKLRTELEKIVNVPNESNLSFLKVLASRTSIIRSLIRMEVRDRMLEHFKSFMTRVEELEPQVILCLEVLGSLIPKQSVVEFVIGSLVKLNRLKALVVFTSTLMRTDRDHLNKWMQYSLYTLVSKSDSKFEITSQILISVRERNFVEKLCNDSIILTILTNIPPLLTNIDERESLLRETLQILLTDELKKKNGNRKIISESISCINKMLEEGISPPSDIIALICDLIPLASGHHLIELLTICRKFYSKTLPREIVGIEKICQILKKIFDRYLGENKKSDRIELYGDQGPESEVLEAAVQVLGVISCSPSIATKLELIKSFEALFNQRSNDIPFITSSIPVLFSVNFELDQEVLKEIFGWDKNVDIIHTLCSYLKASDSSLLQTSIIQTLRDESHFERVSFLQTFRSDLFFKDLIPTLCHCVLSSVDTETQRNVINLMTTLFQFPKEGSIQMLYSSSLLDLLFLIIENKDGTFSRSLRVDTSELVLILKQGIKENISDKGMSLKQLLEEVEPPQECLKSLPVRNDVNSAPVSASEKVKEIESLFNNSLNQPTMDLIEELTRRQLNDDHHAEEKRQRVCRTIHDMDDLVVFYTNPSNHLIQDEDPEEESGIIDDIISAQIRPNAASTDCY